MDEYKETATLDQDGKVLSLECDGVSMPTGYGFAAVNDWVHDTGRHYEELEWHALGAANAYDQLHAENTALKQRLTMRGTTMDNQHRKISGYRELDQAEIALMNEIKAKGVELGELITKVKAAPLNEPDAAAYSLFDAERTRWAGESATTLQTGIMQLVRAVALPQGF